MKIRTGFVSNSSSSSFVILGYKLSFNDDKESVINIVKMFEPEIEITSDDKPIDLLYYVSEKKYGFKTLVDYKNQALYVGSLIARFNNLEDVDTKEISISELMINCNLACEKLGIREEPKLYTFKIWG